MTVKIVAILTFLFCASAATASAGQSPREIDTVMAKIYAASAGNWQGEWHSRSVSRGTAWSTQPQQFTCKLTGARKRRCEGAGVDNTWVSDSHVENGVEYEKANSNGKILSEEFRITHAQFINANNYSHQRTWTTAGADGAEYESIDTLIRMGDRFVLLRKVRKHGSDGDYQYSAFEAVDLVK